MTNWLTQEGYPVITVTRNLIESNDTIVFDLKQKYFLLYESNKKPKE
jgi:hypothetical protein